MFSRGSEHVTASRTGNTRLCEEEMGGSGVGDSLVCKPPSNGLFFLAIFDTMLIFLNFIYRGFRVYEVWIIYMSLPGAKTKRHSLSFKLESIR
jgi:hypothetical protein